MTIKSLYRGLTHNAILLLITLRACVLRGKVANQSVCLLLLSPQKSPDLRHLGI